jgi:hypothetical protein
MGLHGQEESRNGVGILLRHNDCPGPEPALQLFRARQGRHGHPRLDGLQAKVHVSAEEGADFRALRLGDHRGTQVGRPDGVGLVKYQFPPDLEAGRGHPKSERQEERQQAKDGRDYSA